MGAYKQWRKQPTAAIFTKHGPCLLPDSLTTVCLCLLACCSCLLACLLAGQLAVVCLLAGFHASVVDNVDNTALGSKSLLQRWLPILPASKPVLIPGAMDKTPRNWLAIRVLTIRINPPHPQASPSSISDPKHLGPLPCANPRSWPIVQILPQCRWQAVNQISMLAPNLTAGITELATGTYITEKGCCGPRPLLASLFDDKQESAYIYILKCK